MNSRIEQLNSFIAENPNDPFLHYALAQEFNKLGLIEAAEEKYVYLIENYQTYVATYYHYGSLLAKKGLKENALQVYQEGIHIAKSIGDSHSLSELQSAKLNLEIADDDE